MMLFSSLCQSGAKIVKVFLSPLCFPAPSAAQTTSGNVCFLKSSLSQGAP